MRTAKTDQTGWMPRLIWVITGRACHFVGSSSYSLMINKMSKLLKLQVFFSFQFGDQIPEDNTVSQEGVPTGYKAMSLIEALNGPCGLPPPNTMEGIHVPPPTRLVSHDTESHNKRRSGKKYVLSVNLQLQYFKIYFDLEKCQCDDLASVSSFAACDGVAGSSTARVRFFLNLNKASLYRVFRTCSSVVLIWLKCYWKET